MKNAMSKKGELDAGQTKHGSRCTRLAARHYCHNALIHALRLGKLVV